MSQPKVLVKDDSFIKSASRLRAALDKYEAALEADPILVATEPGNTAPADKPDLAILEGLIVEAADRVRSIVVNPHLEMIAFSLRAAAVSAIRIVHDLELFELIPVGESITLQKLVEATGADEAVLVRYLRLLTCEYIFVETAPNTFTHSRLSVVMKGRGFPDWVLLHSGFLRAMSTEKEFLAQRKYKEITDPVDATLQYALGVKKGFFDILADNPTLGETFHYAMQGVQKIAEKPSPSWYPFKEVLKPDPKTSALKTIVDVGGGSGHWMTLIQETFPDLQFRAVVQDFESAFATTQKSTNEKAVPIEYQAHDFFNPQPVKGAEIYFLSHIFHDWPSTQCVKILQRLVEAMKPKHSRLLIVDAIVPEMEASRSIIAFDAVVNIVAGGMERTRQQWLDLVSTATPRLTLAKTYGEASSTNQILEFLFE